MKQSSEKGAAQTPTCPVSSRDSGATIEEKQKTLFFSILKEPVELFTRQSKLKKNSLRVIETFDIHIYIYLGQVISEGG